MREVVIAGAVRTAIGKFGGTQIIEKILKHLDLLETRNHDLPSRKATHIPELIIDPSYSQLPET